MKGRYHLSIFVNLRALEFHRPQQRPFVRIWPRGWRAALAVLRGRYEITVWVGADRDTTDRVLALNPEYVAPPRPEAREVTCDTCGKHITLPVGTPVSPDSAFCCGPCFMEALDADWSAP